MSKTYQNNQDTSNTQSSVEEKNSSNSSTELVKMKDIPNTPFKLVTLEQGHFIAYGNNRLTDSIVTGKQIGRASCRERV